MPQWLTATLPLVGVALGIIGATWQDARRWRRDWFVSQVNSSRTHFAEVLEALYAQHLLLQQATRQEPDRERIAAVTSNWRTQLVRSLTLAPPPVQHALERYDQVRGRTVDAINAKSQTAMSNCLSDLDEARLGVLSTINEHLDLVNEELSAHVLSWWQRVRGAKPPKSIPIQSRHPIL